jgi:TonB family protein
MRFTPLSACVIALLASALCAQQQTRTAIYSAGPDVAAPVLLPQTLAIQHEKCKKKHKGEVVLSLYVTPQGKARRITFLRATGNELDQLALDTASADQFTPGSRNGEPVAVWQSLTIQLQGCVDNPKDPNSTYHLAELPRQVAGVLPDPPPVPTNFLNDDANQTGQVSHVGNGVSAPVPLLTPDAIFSDQARRKRISGVCLISLIVDAHGMPKNPGIVRGVGYGLDENAIAAVHHYRFKPALKGGFEPVPVMLAIEVNFRLY